MAYKFDQQKLMALGYRDFDAVSRMLKRCVRWMDHNPADKRNKPPRHIAEFLSCIKRAPDEQQTPKE